MVFDLSDSKFVECIVRDTCIKGLPKEVGWNVEKTEQGESLHASGVVASPWIEDEVTKLQSDCKY
jgi:hypothetical protein